MKARSWLAATVLGALLTPAAARAEGLDGRFTIAFQGGTQSELGGDLLKGATGTLFSGKAVTLDSKSYKDVYAPDLRLQGLVGYGLSERLEIIARGTYYKANGTALEVGKLEEDPVYVFFDPYPGDAFDPYGDYEEVGVELGLRFYIAAAGRLKSYVAPIVGARWLTETYVRFEVPEAGSAIRNVPLHEKSTVPVFGLDIGFNFDLGEHFFVGVDTGLRYQGAPKGADGLPGFPQIDDSDGRWSAPVSATIGVRF
jgi:hypothetical protein